MKRLVLCSILAACTIPEPSADLVCETTRDCEAGRVCDRGYCVIDVDVDVESLRTGCVLMQHMDERWTGTAGEVADDCGDDDLGTVSGGPSTVTGGVRRRAGSFAETSCIEVPDSPALRATNGLTLSAWVQPTKLDGSYAKGLISKRVDMSIDSAYNLFVWTQDNVYVDLGEHRFFGRRPLIEGQWAQVTAVFDADAQSVRIYINGMDVPVEDATTAAVGPTITIPPVTPPLRVGCLSGQASQHFAGLMDEVAIWTRPLTPPEVSRWYAATSSGK